MITGHDNSTGTMNCTSREFNFTGNFTCNSTEAHFFGHELSKAFASFVGAYFLLVVVVAAVGNTILIATITSVRRLHSVTHAFIINLAVGDLITAVVTIPFDIDFLWRGHFAYGKFMCGVMHISFLLALPSSVINLCLLTIDRFISIQWPFRKMRWLKRRNIIIAIVASWTYTILVALFPIMYDPASLMVVDGVCLISPFPLSYDIFMMVVNFLIPIILILAMNVLLFVIANNHGKQIKQLTRSNTENASSNSRGRRRSRRGTITFGANMKAAKRILLLVGVFIVCWLCYIILVAMNLSCNECHPREVTWMGNVVNYSSVAINPVLYGLLNKAVRKEMFRKLRLVIQKCLAREASSLSVRSSAHAKSNAAYESSVHFKASMEDNGEATVML